MYNTHLNPDAALPFNSSSKSSNAWWGWSMAKSKHNVSTTMNSYWIIASLNAWNNYRMTCLMTCNSLLDHCWIPLPFHLHDFLGCTCVISWQPPHPWFCASIPPLCMQDRHMSLPQPMQGVITHPWYHPLYTYFISIMCKGVACIETMKICHGCSNSQQGPMEKKKTK